ncbi:hypothetical protein E3N88_44887 [Mikania micrantha]|uniref:Integrase catalytic domain-containing protein n=1 Tax=Mikania micrantha TaxID=192012 RepID=A0A5N6LBE2_9ASTR|nr:hypothetical protein E3N88_44887 [Mikania micrantha]
MVERQFQTKLKFVQTDWGGEFRPLSSFFSSHGVIHRLSCPRTNEQNGFLFHSDISATTSPQSATSSTSSVTPIPTTIASDQTSIFFLSPTSAPSITTSISPAPIQTYRRRHKLPTPTQSHQPPSTSTIHTPHVAHAICSRPANLRQYPPQTKPYNSSTFVTTTDSTPTEPT